MEYLRKVWLRVDFIGIFYYLCVDLYRFALALWKGK